MAKPQRAKVTRRTSKNISEGKAVVNSSFNNTHGAFNLIDRHIMKLAYRKTVIKWLSSNTI